MEVSVLNSLHLQNHSQKTMTKNNVSASSHQLQDKKKKHRIYQQSYKKLKKVLVEGGRSDIYRPSRCPCPRPHYRGVDDGVSVVVGDVVARKRERRSLLPVLALGSSSGSDESREGGGTGREEGIGGGGVAG